MPTPPLADDDWRRIRDALRYMARDLHHRSYGVTANRRELLWQEMDLCLALSDRIEAHLDGDGREGADPPAAASAQLG